MSGPLFSDQPMATTATMFGSEEKKDEQLRVAAYVRVSSLTDQQEGSLDNQKQHFTHLIRTTPEWKMVEVFIDQGKTGTAIKKRPAFQKMMRRARSGEIDLILCKSVSRFARNVVDAVESIRELKELGVRVIFDKEQIDTDDMTSEFFLTMLAAVAQEESRSVSDNIKWGWDKKFERGEVAARTTLGYRRNDEGEWEIVESEAKIVREAFEEAAKGKKIAHIARQFIMKRYAKSNGRQDWSSVNIKSMLTDLFYVGDVICRKSYRETHLSEKRYSNEGQKDQVLIEEHHPPIVSRELFEKVQSQLEERARKNDQKKMTQNRYPFSGRITCGCCGASFHRYNARSNLLYRCYNRMKSLALCRQESVYHDRLLSALSLAFLERYEGSRQRYDLQKMKKELKSAVASRDMSYNRLKLELEKSLHEENMLLLDTKRLHDPSVQAELDQLGAYRHNLEHELHMKKEWWDLLDHDEEYRIDALAKLTEMANLRNPEKALHEQMKNEAFLRAWVVSVKAFSPVSFLITWLDGQETTINLE